MRSSGFTLIEVLVALVVASLTMAAVAHSGLSLIAGGRASELEQAASLIAERTLEELVARGALGLASEASFDPVDDPLGTFEQSLFVSPGERPNLWHLLVTVAPPGGAAPVTLQTLLRRPWAEP